MHRLWDIYKMCVYVYVAGNQTLVGEVPAIIIYKVIILQ